MAGNTFGKTWWGNEWLKSLTHIDYANRIPRGSAYARKGAVRSIDVTGNVITARVSGSRPTPYKVTIRVPLFKKEQTDLLMKKLLEQPALISKLLNRELDPEVFQVARRIGLNLFPQRSMHGVDLLDELKKRHVEIEKEQVMDVPEFVTLLERRMPKEMGSDLFEFHRVDCSSLRDIAEPLANLLMPSPTSCMTRRWPHSGSRF